MKKIISFVVLIVLLLSACSNVNVNESVIDNISDSETNEVVVNFDDNIMTCSEGLSLILEDEQGFENVSNDTTILYQRGGAYNDQLTIDFTNKTMHFNDVSYTYHGDPYEDEYFHWILPDRDYSDENELDRQNMLENSVLTTWDYVYNTGIITIHDDAGTRNFTDVEYERFAFTEFYEGINNKLDSIGCNLAGYSPSILNSYNNQNVASESYWEDNDILDDPLEVMEGLGMDTMVYEMPEYQELSNWQDYVNIDPYITLEDGSRKNVGFILVVYDNTWADVTKSVIEPSQPFYDAETFFKYRLTTDFLQYNNFLTQNFFRDFWYKYAEWDAPKLYFIDAEVAANSKFLLTDDFTHTVGESGLWKFTNRLTIEEAYGGGDWIFHFRPSGDSVEYLGFAWIPSIDMELDTLQWFMQYMDRSTWSDDILKEYIKVYDIEWQRMFGAFEIYREKYGF